ncbi:MAG: DUF4384 domain-containing protein [Acidobacteria bacterium]|nr:DUF4384 domain-containing protein [Acidobacteriota bacterium]MBI3423213.1 DUF4384 domain-containing protein [Acidobacteriota bacterium]
MKPQARLMAVLSFLCILPLLAFAQAAAPDDRAARDIVNNYQSGKVNGVELAILLVQANGALLPVEPQREFKTGEQIKLALESNFGGYLYIVNYGSSGAQRVIFPCSGEDNQIKPRQKYLLPNRCAFAFDENTGTEVLKVFTSRQPIAFLATAAKRADGTLNAREVAALERWWQDGNAQSPGISGSTIKMESSRAMESRDPVWDAKKKTALVTLRQQKGAGGKLVRNKVAMFRINMKNGGTKGTTQQ